MMDSKLIMQLAEQNNGMITTAMVVDLGLSRGSLKYLADIGKLDHSSRGVYTLPNVLEDEFVNVQSRYKRGIYSLDTALYFYDLTDKTPNNFHMFFPSTYNLTNPQKDGILCRGMKDPLFSIGVDMVNTPSGNKVRCYSVERTLCDILRTSNNVDIQVVSCAFKRYITRKDRNIPLLSEYARKFHVDKRLRSYLEVLL